MKPARTCFRCCSELPSDNAAYPMCAHCFPLSPLLERFGVQWSDDQLYSILFGWSTGDREPRLPTRSPIHQALPLFPEPGWARREEIDQRGIFSGRSFPAYNIGAAGFLKKLVSAEFGIVGRWRGTRSDEDVAEIVRIATDALTMLDYLERDERERERGVA